MLSSLTRKIYPPSDDCQLVYNYEDNSRIEPEWYCPILPMVLVNGAEGIGTGYSTSVPNFNPREIVANLMKLMSNLEPTAMVLGEDYLCLKLEESFVIPRVSLSHTPTVLCSNRGIRISPAP